MMQRLRSINLIGLTLGVALVGLVAGGCATEATSDGESVVAVTNDSADGSTASDDQDVDSAEPTTTPDSGGAVDGDGSSTNGDDGEPAMAASSPIGAYFADGGGFEKALAEYTIRVEETIVVCMAAQGFEFVRTTSRVNEVDELQNELSVRDWTTEYGYGISTSFDSLAQGQATDPNADILFSLSAAEREIWIETLTGGGLEGIRGDFGAKPLEEQGCIGQALIETGGQEAIEGIETFSGAYEEGEAALLDRREMIEVIDKWTRCMSEAGHPGYSALDDPEESIIDRYVEVTAPMQQALDELTPEEGQALVSGESLDLADLPDLDLAALRDLQAEEVAIALVDLDCYEAEVQQTYEPLRDDFENGLLTEYSTEFEALRNIGG